MRSHLAKPALLLLATMVASLTLAMAAPGAQAQSTCFVDPTYQGGTTFSASASSVAAGSTVVLSGSGYPAGASITISVNGSVVGTAVTNASGAFTFSYTVPAGTTAGSLPITAGCGSFVQGITIQVLGSNVARPVAATSNSLPLTGSNNLGLAQIALALVAAGGLLLLIVRRRTAPVHEGDKNSTSR
jgi:LPXTG-motif cell wall-anchored protein